ncbi:MAG: dTDP-4-dehydrorhamnose reductase [Bacteroidales bacterium]|nr:dTDP-4-dehydrorhamnose reductase [Bacteroidales bacterium]
MNILVTGANGQLGNEMRIVSKGSPDRYIFTDVEELDILDKNAVMDIVKNEQIQVVVNCAAYTNVDKAEDEPEMAEKLNATAVGYLAEACKANDATLIHISTDYVFGGNEGNTPRKEDEPANPTGAYGRSKLHGEQAIQKTGCKHIIIRTAWLYSEFGHNFVKTMLKLTAEKDNLNVVFDQIGTPTYALDLAEAILKIIHNLQKKEDNYQLSTINYQLFGVYHFSNEGVISWYDFAKEICELGGNKCDIQPCHSDEFPSKVKRPAYSVLDKTKIKKTFNISIPYWKDSLRRCLSKYRYASVVNPFP